MSSTDWYIVQVLTGKERRLRQLILAACEEEVEEAAADEPLRLDECFAPRFRAQKKVRGEWREVERLLMPGYLVTVVNRPDKLAQVLRKLPEPCRLLSVGETYVPLTSYEREWLEANTQKGDRVVPMSLGYKQGDTITVTDGPLVGQEGRIVKVKRSASLAYLEFHVGQVTIKTTVGLGIVPKDQPMMSS